MLEVTPRELNRLQELAATWPPKNDQAILASVLLKVINDIERRETHKQEQRERS